MLKRQLLLNGNSQSRDFGRGEYCKNSFYIPKGFLLLH